MMKSSLIVCTLIILLISCKDSKKEIRLSLESVTICYTVPQFYVKDLNFQSEMYFSYKVKIKNDDKLDCRIDSNSIFIEDVQGKFTYLKYAQRQIVLKKSDSTLINIESPIKYKVDFDEAAIMSKIYPIADSLLKQAKLFYVFNGDTIQIKASKDFYSNSNPIEK